jgi:hypothetical protein
MGFLVDQAWEDQFRKTSYVYLYKTYYAKSLLRKYCKEGICCNPFLGPYSNKKKMQKNKKYIRKKNKKSNSGEKRMSERSEND